MKISFLLQLTIVPGLVVAQAQQCSTIFGTVRPSKVPTSTTTVVRSTTLRSTVFTSPGTTITKTSTLSFTTTYTVATSLVRKTSKTTVTVRNAVVSTKTVFKTKTPETSTSTVAAPSGFLPIQVEQSELHFKRDLDEDFHLHKRAVYPTLVQCTATKTSTFFTTVTTTGSKTFTKTTTNPDPAQYSQTSTVYRGPITLTVTSTAFVTSDFTTTTTVTKTKTAPPRSVETIYEVCSGTLNYASHTDPDNQDINFFETNADNPPLYVTQNSTRVDCCNQCAELGSLCSGSVFNILKQECISVISTNPDVCDPENSYEIFTQHVDQLVVPEHYFISNPPCNRAFG